MLLKHFHKHRFKLNVCFYLRCAFLNIGSSIFELVRLVTPWRVAILRRGAAVARGCGKGRGHRGGNEGRVEGWQAAWTAGGRRRGHRPRDGWQPHGHWRQSRVGSCKQYQCCVFEIMPLTWFDMLFIKPNIKTLFSILFYFSLTMRYGRVALASLSACGSGRREECAEWWRGRRD